MRLGLVLILGLMVFAAADPALAQPYRRLVNFEWEPIEGATAYDLELKQTKKDGKTFKFKVKEASWAGRLAPGDYEMRLRALDYRGVPGDWSDNSDFGVGLESARLVFPAPSAAVPGRGGKESPVEFKWEPVGGASRYKIEVTADDGSFRKQEELKDTRLKLDLPVGKAYTWKVSGHAGETIKSEAVSLGQFSMLGAKLAKPVIEKPENEFVRDIRWKRPDHATAFDVTVFRRTNDKKWEKLQEFRDLKEETVAFAPDWSGGLYRAEVRAKGEMRPPSDVSVSAFKVRKGDRSPAAEFTAEVRKSIDRINGWYGIASYLITMISYKSTMADPDTTSGSPFSAPFSGVGGTGRLGAGYMKDDRKWGFQGIMDLSGFIDNKDTVVNFSSMELNAILRPPSDAADRSEVRYFFGVFQQELPVGIGDPLVNGSEFQTYEKVAVMGPHVGAEFWYSITPKIGFQANAHLYLNMMKMQTPNGQDIEPSMSYQIGLLGSYRVNRQWTGLAGIAQKDLAVKYKSNPVKPLHLDQANEVSLSGTYLNFFAEYAF